MTTLAQKIEAAWYSNSVLNHGWRLLFLAPLWCLAAPIILAKYPRHKQAKNHQQPVLVVGNITVGGTGKTPLIIALVARAKQLGLTPAIVSRGFGGQSKPSQQSKDANISLLVTPESDAAECGDEPVLLAQRLNCPVMVNAKRQQAVDAVLKQFPDTNIIFSDDGLQHYAMSRAGEILVVDQQRGFGNGWLLPLGPLREPVARRHSVELELVNGHVSSGDIDSADFTVQPTRLVNAASGEEKPMAWLSNKTVQAVAGIGNPQSFYRTLSQQGCEVIEHSYADHYAFAAEDFSRFNTDDIVVMTEKDWVKCQSFAEPNMWYLVVDAVFFDAAIEEKIDQLLLAVAGQ